MEEATHAWENIIKPYGRKLMRSREMAKEPQESDEEVAKDANEGLRSLQDLSISELLADAGVSEEACRVLDCVVMQTDAALYDDCSILLEVMCEDKDSTGNLTSRYVLMSQELCLTN